MASVTTIALWLVAIAACLAVLLLWRRTRRLSAQLEQLSGRYWELKYEHHELRQQLQRSDGPSIPAAAPPPRSGDAFVPLASLKR